MEKFQPPLLLIQSQAMCLKIRADLTCIVVQEKETQTKLGLES